MANPNMHDLILKMSQNKQFAVGPLPYIHLVFTDVIQTEILLIICIEAIIDLAHLSNVALLLHAQRSSRYKNCRNCGLMFNNQHISDVIFYPHILQQPQVSKNIPAHARLVAVMIWHCYRTKTFEVCNPRINFCLYTQCTHAVALNNKNTWTYIFSAVKFTILVLGSQSECACPLQIQHSLAPWLLI